MIVLLLFSGIVLSISWIIYSYAKGIGEEIGKKMKEKEKGKRKSSPPRWGSTPA